MNSPNLIYRLCICVIFSGWFVFPELLNFDTANLWNFIGDARASDATSAEVTRALAASAGAIWLKRQVYALDWNVSVQYRYSAASSPPGDGLCIVLHRDTAIGISNPGWGGAYMGYGGIRNSTALCVDLYTDANVFNNKNGFGVYTGGNVVQVPPFLLASNLVMSSWYTIEAGYRRRSGFLEFRVRSGGTIVGSWSTDIGDITQWIRHDIAWLGITGDSQISYAAQDVRNFDWQSQCPNSTWPTTTIAIPLGVNIVRLSCAAGLVGSTTVAAMDTFSCEWNTTAPTCLNASSTVTPTASRSVTASPSKTATATITNTTSRTPSRTTSPSSSGSMSMTSARSSNATLSRTAAPTLTQSESKSPWPVSSSVTTTPSVTCSYTSTASQSSTGSITPTASRSASPSSLSSATLVRFDTPNMWSFVGDARMVNATTAGITVSAPFSVGAVWLRRQVYSLDWNVSMQYQYSNATSPGGDGLCIVLHRDTAINDTGRGEIGSSLGYGGIKNSTAMCVDLHSATSPNKHGLGVYTGGPLPLPQVAALLFASNLVASTWYTVQAGYSRRSGVVELTMRNGAALVGRYSLNIGDISQIIQHKTAWVGVTGATGSSYAAQDVRNFDWQSQCPNSTWPTTIVATPLGVNIVELSCAAGLVGPTTVAAMDRFSCEWNTTAPTCVNASSTVTPTASRSVTASASGTPSLTSTTSESALPSILSSAIFVRFDDSNMWNFVGDARFVGATTAGITVSAQGRGGAVWLNQQVYALDWSISMQYRYSNASSPPADGLCIVLHRDAAINTTGLATSPNRHGLGVYTNGNVVPQTPALLLVSNLNSSAWYTVQAGYSQQTGVVELIVRNGAAVVGACSINIGDVSQLIQHDTAWVGVTGATGGGYYAAQDIRNFVWQSHCPDATWPSTIEATLLDVNIVRLSCAAGLVGSTTVAAMDRFSCVWNTTSPTCVNASSTVTPTASSSTSASPSASVSPSCSDTPSASISPSASDTAATTSTITASTTSVFVGVTDSVTSTLTNAATATPPSTTNTAKPTPVSLPFVLNGPIAVGCHHVCRIVALRKVYCWGDNSAGQCGKPSSIRHIADFKAALELGPINVSLADAHLTGVTCGCTHTCVQGDGGGVQCWGEMNSDEG